MGLWTMGCRLWGQTWEDGRQTWGKGADSGAAIDSGRWDAD